MKVKGNPCARTLYVWNCTSAFFFFSRITPFHSHNTMQLVFDLRNKFKCRLQDEEWNLYKTIAIKENSVHQLDTNGSTQLLIYLDAETDIAKAIKTKYLKEKDIVSLDMDIVDFVKPGELERCLIKGDKKLLEKIVSQLLNELVTVQKSISADERIKIVIKHLTTNDPAQMRINLLAKKVYLSESRLRYLFKSSVGISLHRYIIWNRIMLAINKILSGSSVSQAAMDCGFSDSSHFHKILLKMFGISPSQFITENKKSRLVICTSFPLKLETRVPITGNKPEVYRI